jgi:hypothetical protein
VGTVRFLIYLAMLLIVPAAFYVIVLHDANLLAGFRDRYFLVNYLYWAAPHLIFSTIAFVLRAQRKTLLLNLATFNVMLIARHLWVVLIPRASYGELEVLAYYLACVVGLFATHLLRLVFEPGYED